MLAIWAALLAMARRGGAPCGAARGWTLRMSREAKELFPKRRSEVPGRYEAVSGRSRLLNGRGNLPLIGLLYREEAKLKSHLE